VNKRGNYFGQRKDFALLEYCKFKKEKNESFELQLMNGELLKKESWVYEANRRSTRRPTFFFLGPTGGIRGLGQLCGG
jgi:hypothetical protein